MTSSEDLLKFVVFYRPETNFIVRKTNKGKHCVLVVSASIKRQMNGEVESSYGGNRLQMLQLIFDDFINAF